MQLAEQHVIRKTDPRFAAIDQAAFASKNLYNAANYIVRQAYIHEGIYLDNVEVFQRISSTLYNFFFGQRARRASPPSKSAAQAPWDDSSKEQGWTSCPFPMALARA